MEHYMNNKQNYITEQWQNRNHLNLSVAEFDTTLAKKLDTQPYAIKAIRRKLNLVSGKRKTHAKKNYTNKEIEFIKDEWVKQKPTVGTVDIFDKFIAQELKRTPSAIGRYRSVLGLVAFNREAEEAGINLNSLIESSFSIKITNIADNETNKVLEMVTLIEEQATKVLSKISKAGKIKVEWE